MPVDVGPMRIVAQTHDVLGEIPLWDHRIQRLAWMDFIKPALHLLDPATGAVTTSVPPEKIGSYALRRDGGYIVAGRSGLSLWDAPCGRFERIATPEADRPQNIMSDGRCDAAGRFLFGSMDRAIAGPSGRLWSINADRRLSLLEDGGILVPNSLCWSPGGRILYFGDSRHELIHAYDYDPAEGRISGRRVFADTSGLPGVLDGSSVDGEGFVWHARFGGGQLVRFTPDGRIDQVIETPVRQPTHVTFGGPEMRTLFITTARFRLSPDALERMPLSGGLFACEVGVAGMQESIYAG